MKTFAQMLAALAAKGFTQTQIAKEVKSDQSTISRIAAGKQNPGYVLGKSIEEFYKSEITDIQAA